MESWGALISAVLGSSGLAAVIAGVVPLSRVRRLKSRIEVLEETCRLTDAASPEGRAISVAMRQLKLDLAVSVMYRSGRAGFVAEVVGLAAVAVAVLASWSSGNGGLAVLAWPIPVQGVQSPMLEEAIRRLMFGGGLAVMEVGVVLAVSARRRAKRILQLGTTEWHENQILKSSVEPLLGPFSTGLNAFSKLVAESLMAVVRALVVLVRLPARLLRSAFRRDRY